MIAAKAKEDDGKKRCVFLMKEPKSSINRF